MNSESPARAHWRDVTYRIIFSADTPAGKLFDILLVCSILASVLAVMLDSVDAIHARWATAFIVIEWIFTIGFTLEYLARIVSVSAPRKYIFSFMGLVDLLSTLPSYLGLFLAGTNYAFALRLLRLLRIFRVLKLASYLEEGQLMAQALAASKRKLLVFLLAILTLVMILGTMMYAIEGPVNGFTSIPISIYWAIVTITTVGYGDIAPHTPPGQFLASIVMILGYIIIAVPTGIVGVELNRIRPTHNLVIACPRCLLEGHEKDANYCRRCGEHLQEHDRS
ncbi:MAG: ion transporter [Gallionella sp.]|nr:ion transporter [Gallionella sp.]MDD4945468.1 ion transporter [Gallionella sp.]MDD5612489.1 ion transporter [Gallionella sp.]